MWPRLLLLTVLLVVSAPGSATAQGCPGNAPVAGWVCQNGGWLPANHPALVPASPGLPPSTTAPSLPPFRQLAWGAGVSLGTEVCLTHPPLILTPTDGLVWSGLGRYYTNCNPSYTGPLVIVQNLSAYVAAPFSLPYAPHFTVTGLSVFCGHNWAYDGIEVQAHHTTLVDATVKGCRAGILFERAVNVTVERGNLVGNRNGLWLKGNGPASLDGAISLTHLRFHGTRVSTSSQAAVLIGHGLGVVFDGAILEGNHAEPVRLEPTWAGAALSTVRFRDVWFEANGSTAITGPLSGAVAFEGSTSAH